MSKEKQIDIISKIIARKAADYRNPNVVFMTTAKKSATAIYHEFLDMQRGREGEWISVEDRLPNLDPYGKGRYGGQRSVRVLCACKQRNGRTFVKEGYYEPCSNGKVVWRIPGSIDSVTHWMPLPNPPLKGGEE